MAVAAVLGGASPNFGDLYNELGRLSGKLSIASPRELNDPGQVLQFTDNTTTPPTTFDTYIRPVITDNTTFGRRGPTFAYQLFYKDGNNNEQMISDGNNVNNANITAGNFRINGVNVANGNVLKLDDTTGRIILNTAGGAYNPSSTSNITLGIMKLDAVTGLDMALINDRITQTNIVIEALNKVLLVATGNVDKGVDLRI